MNLVVEGKRTDVGATKIGGGDVRVLPGAFGDPFRMLEALPGVTPIVSGLPYFYVRGAPPGDTGYFVDGVPLPLLFHVGAGPSVLSSALIDHVDFLPGGAPARYGRYTGGIVAAETTAPRDARRIEYGARLFDATALVETPFGDRDRGDALVAARYGYPGLVLHAVSPNVGLQYWDYQARAGWRVDERDRVSIFVFGAYDRLTDEEKHEVLFGTQFHRADVRFDRRLGDDGGAGALRLAATLGWDATDLGKGEFATSSPLVRVRAELDRSIAGGSAREGDDERVRLRAGADAGESQSSIVAGSGGSSEGDAGNRAELARLFPTRADRTLGAWGDLVVRPAKGVELVPGVRFDLFASRSTVRAAADPRLSTRIALARRIAWISSFALVHQPPSFVLPVPGLQFGELDRGLQEAHQFSQGFEARLPYAITARATAFHHVILDAGDVFASCPGSGGDRDRGCNIDDRATARTDGIELFVARALTARIGGWISYTLSRSVRTFRGATFLSRFDRPHVLTTVASIDVGHGWRIGGRLAYLSGLPYDDPTGTVDARGVPKGPGGRLPSFTRLDVRIEKRWITSTTSWISFVAEWFNATLQREAIELRCAGPAPGAGCTPRYVGPVTIPSIGFEGAI